MPVTVIVGDNGCGKSSLIQSIRGKFEKDKNNLRSDDYVKLAQNIEIETDFTKFFFFDSINDDGLNMNNSYDASAFITNGGFHTQKLSHGQAQLYYISKLLNQIEKFRETSDEKIMIILDEFDKGFSLANQSKVNNILYNICNKYKCSVICISHNYLLIQKCGVVYDMETRDILLSDEYLKKLNI